MPRSSERARYSAKPKVEQTAEELAIEVLELLGQAQSGKVLEGKAETDGQWLAAILCLLSSQVVEVYKQTEDHPGIHAVTDPKQRIAAEAGRMFVDIANGRKHLIHKMFQGIRFPQNAPKRRPLRVEVIKRCLLDACIRRLIDTRRRSGCDAPLAVEFMTSNSVLREALIHHPRITKDYSEHQVKPEYSLLINEFVAVMKSKKIETEESIIAWTAANYSLYAAPLDMQAATEIETRNEVLFDGEGNPVFFVRPRLRFEVIPPPATEQGTLPRE